jgi:GAF domain-containing protein
VNTVTGVYYPGLYELALSLSSTHSSKEILRNLAEKVSKTIGAKGCALILLSPDKKQLFHITSYGLSDRHVKKGPILSDQSISEAIQGRTVAIIRASEDERIHYRKEAEREGIASILSVPMKLKEKVIGVIRVYTSEPREFTGDDIYFVQAVASLAAAALKNAKFYSSIQKNNQKVKQELLEITSLLNS